MQVYLVSVRTALIFGPGEILEAQNPHGNTLRLRAQWEHAQSFDEWEGYAVVVPERNQVWGLAKPELDDQILSASFDFYPRPIPPKDKRLFDALMKAPQQASQDQASEEEQEADED